MGSEQFTVFGKPVCVTGLDVCEDPFRKCPGCLRPWDEMTEIEPALWSPFGCGSRKFDRGLRICDCGKIRYENACGNCEDEQARLRELQEKKERDTEDYSDERAAMRREQRANMGLKGSLNDYPHVYPPEAK